MNSTTMKTWMTLFAATLTIFAGASPAKAETLGEILRRTGWERIIDTLIVTIEGIDAPVTLTLVRMKE